MLSQDRICKMSISSIRYIRTSVFEFRFVDKVKESYGRVDALINNAAMGLADGATARQTTQV